MALASVERWVGEVGEKTGISWTHSTWNGWWGCEEVSRGCNNCYARVLSERHGFKIWGGKDTPRHRTSENNWNEPFRWNRAAAKEGRRRRAFAQSMSDLLEDHPMVSPWRMRAWETMEQTEWIDWLALTKRPENWMRMVPQRWIFNGAPPNIWLLTSTEDQENAELRTIYLAYAKLMLKVKIAGVSAEPLLGGIDFRRIKPLPHSAVVRMHRGIYSREDAMRLADQYEMQRKVVATWASNYGHVERDGSIDMLGSGLINWVIAGGESAGPAKRALVERMPDGKLQPKVAALDWLYRMRDDCAATGQAFFFKQYGGPTSKSGGKLLDGVEYCQFPDEMAGAV